jgi:hypothetical protein
VYAGPQTSFVPEFFFSPQTGDPSDRSTLICPHDTSRIGCCTAWTRVARGSNRSRQFRLRHRWRLSPGTLTLEFCPPSWRKVGTMSSTLASFVLSLAFKIAFPPHTRKSGPVYPSWPVRIATVVDHACTTASSLGTVEANARSSVGPQLLPFGLSHYHFLGPLRPSFFYIFTIFSAARASRVETVRYHDAPTLPLSNRGKWLNHIWSAAWHNCSDARFCTTSPSFSSFPFPTSP